MGPNRFPNGSLFLPNGSLIGFLILITYSLRARAFSSPGPSRTRDIVFGPENAIVDASPGVNCAGEARCVPFEGFCTIMGGKEKRDLGAMEWEWARVRHLGGKLGLKRLLSIDSAAWAPSYLYTLLRACPILRGVSSLD